MNKITKYAVIGGSLVIVSLARAVDVPFDSTTATAGFGTAAAAAAIIVGGLVTLGAGLMVYRKIAGYFGKAK